MAALPLASGRLNRGLWIAAACVLGLGALLAAIWAARERVGATFAVDYLRRRGVPAQVRLTRVDARGVEGSVTLGPASAPTLVVPRFRAEFAPLSGLRAPRIARLVLDGPRLDVSWDGRRLRLGALQPLLEEALRAPAAPAGPPPVLAITAGRLHLATPYGPLLATVDAASGAAGLRRASLHLQPARLASPAGEVQGLSGDLVLQAAAPAGYDADLTLAAATARSGSSAAQRLHAQVHAHVPYRAGAPALLAGPMQGRWLLSAARVEAAGWRVAAVQAGGDMAGVVQTGGRPQFAGRATARVQAAEASRTAGDGSLQAPRVEVAASRLAAAADRLDAAADVRGGAVAGSARAVGERIALAHLRLAARGRLQAAAHGPPALTLDAAFGVAGGLAPRRANALAQRWAPGGFGSELRPVLSTALKRSVLTVSDAQARFDGRTWRGCLDRPATLEGGGARLALGAPAGWSASGASGFAAPRLTVRLAGGGAPRIALDASAVRVSSATSRAAVHLQAAAEALGPLRSAVAAFDGEVTADASGARLALAGCAPLRLGRYLGDDGATAAADVAGELCPAPGAPLLSVAAGGGWRASAQVRALALAAPQAQLGLSGGEADLALRSDQEGPTGEVRILKTEIADTARPVRFRALRVDGPLRLSRDRLTGTLRAALARPKRELGRLAVRQDFATGETHLAFTAPDLRFAPDGLQPAAVLPGLATLGEDVVGAAAVAFNLDLQAGRTTTLVRVQTSDLQLKTVAGLVTGLRTDLTLTGLDPLTSPPGQRLSAARLAGVVPLTDLAARFRLGDQALDLSSARAELAGGAVTLDSTRIGLQPGAGIEGVVRADGVQLAPLLGALNLSKAVTVDARLQGVLPFSFGPAGLRFTDGRLAAMGPGRLTLNREALSGVAAQGGAASASRSAVQDFAFKALEGLDFTELDATVASRPQGRLGVVFHVRGRHEPRVAESDRVDLLALLRGHAFDTRIPLPKGTGVNLTLDTSLNLDDLIGGYSGLSPPAGSAQVQPRNAKP